MNADAKLDPLLGRQAGVALGHAVLHFDCAAHGVDNASELDDAAVAGALDDAAVMGRYRWIDQIAAKASKTRERTLFIGAGEPAISDDIGDQDRGKLPRFRHRQRPKRRAE